MKYYSLCLMTDSIVKGVQRYSSYQSEYMYRYPRAPMGFVFHNTDGPLDLEELKYPLFQLRGLFTDPVPKEALVFKIKENTYAATYSLSALPRPVDVGRMNQRNNITLKVYPQTGDAPGWYITDVTDQSAPIIPFDIGNTYDNCLHLQRLMGACPCPNLANGTCTTENILPTFNGFMDAIKLTADYGSVSTKAIGHASYATLGAFKYISPVYTTEQDFYQSLRPWDNVDFTVVETRVKEYEKRVATRVSANTHVKTHCKKCIFVEARTNKAGREVFNSCVKNPTERCTGELTTEEATQFLQHWYNSVGFGDIKTFTPTQINGLVTLVGSTVSNRGAFSASRKMDLMLTGFVKTAGQWVYRVSAYKGDTRRHVDYKSFISLIEAVPEIVELLKAPHPELPYLRLLGCSILGPHVVTNVGWGNQHNVYAIAPGDFSTPPANRLNSENVSEETLCASSTFTSGRYTHGEYRLYKHTYPRRWVQFISPTYEAAQRYANIRILKQS